MFETKKIAYRPSEAAAIASVSRPTLYRWMKQEGFPVARIGGCTRIPAQAFERWLNERAGAVERATAID